MRRERKRMGDMLLDEGLVTEEQIEFALKAAKEDGMLLGEKLIQLGYVTQESVADALSNQLGLPRVHLEEYKIKNSRDIYTCIKHINRNGYPKLRIFFKFNYEILSITNRIIN